MTQHEDPGVKLTRLSDVTPERVEWLWSGRLPAGKIVTLDGDPGLGKSTLALSIAATVTTGGPWPDGGHCHHRGAVLLLSAEDGLADTVRPRLDAAGADVEQVHAIEGKTLIDPDSGERYLRPLSLADVFDLDTAMAQTSARLLIVDVLMAFLPAGTDAHKDQDIRRVLSALGAACDRNQCTILLLRHLNKVRGGDPLYRGGGSIGIVGAARSGLLVAADPDDPTRRVLASVKSNLGVMPDSLAYRLADSPEHGVARVVWEGTTTHDAHGLLATAAHDDVDDRREIDGWLIELLSQGSVKATEVFSAADAAGYSKDSCKRAKKRAGVQAERPVNPGPWFWSLPSGEQAASTGDSQPGQGAPALLSASPQVNGHIGEQGAQSASVHPLPPPECLVLPALSALPVRSDGVEQGADVRPAPAPQCGSCHAELKTVRSLKTGLCAECQLIASNTEEPAVSTMPVPGPTKCERCYVYLPATASGALCDDCDGAPPAPVRPKPRRRKFLRYDAGGRPVYEEEGA